MMSIAIPETVLISDKASAPWASAMRAKTVMSVTFGDSFTMSGFRLAARTSETTRSVCAGSVPKAIPPCFTFGQEILSSTAATSAMPFSRAASSAYSSAVLPLILIINGMCSCGRISGNTRRTNSSYPTFSKPTQLSIPDGVSAIRTPALPSRGSSVNPFSTAAPSIFGSKKSA